MIQEFGVRCPADAWRAVSIAEGLKESYQQTRQLLAAHPDVQAVIVHGANWAPAVYKAIAESGRTVGQDLAVAAFDDPPVVEFLQPALTVVCEPVDQIAAELARMLLNAIEQSDAPAETVKVESRLVRREST